MSNVLQAIPHRTKSDCAALVACSKSKREKRTVAWQLYDSILFQKSWAAATLVGEPYVMSAKHGLLAVNDRVDPYDETLRNATQSERHEWAQSLDIPSTYETLVLFGGRDYVNPVKDVYGDNYCIVDVYADCTGNGQQMAVAGEIVDTVVGDRT